MARIIAVEDLRVGMFVQLDGGWLSHPFPLSNFRIGSPEQLHTLRGLGLKYVRWAPEKSDLSDSPVPTGAEPCPVPRADTARDSPRQRELAAQRDAARLCGRQHAEAALAWRQATDAVGARPREAAHATQQLTRAILDKMLCSQDIGIRLVRGGADTAASHALNVGVISLLIARTLGMPEPALLELGQGALLHDVGKTEVPERFRHAEEGFNHNEVAAYRDHVARGVALGQRMGLPSGAQAVLAQHHEHIDGSGFPLKLAGERIGMAARVVALVNRYDKLCNPLSRAAALTPHEAVALLFAQGRQRFDSAVLNAFIRMMGVYPAGSLVQLTDDRFALVVAVNSSRPLKPRVLVHDEQVPRHEALVLNLQALPALGIRRSLPAAQLPPAAIDYLDPRPRVAYFFEALHRAADAVAEADAEEPA